MSNEITKQEGGALQLSDKEVEVCNCLTKFNQMRDFKLDAREVLEWKNTILKLVPDLDVDVLRFAIEEMILGKIEYKKDEGIRNIFLAIGQVEKTDTGFKVKSRYRW